MFLLTIEVSDAGVSPRSLHCIDRLDHRDALRLRTTAAVTNARTAEIIAPQAAQYRVKLMRFASVSNASASDATEMAGPVAA